MAETRISAEPGVPQIIVSRNFRAAPAMLLRAHIEPDLLARWLGPRRLRLTVDRLEARDGGIWRYIHHDADGNAYAFHGVFHGTPSIAGIVQTWEDETDPGRVCLSTVTFAAAPGGTTLRQNTVFQSVEDRDRYVRSGMEAGVRESMARLDEVVTHPVRAPDGRDSEPPVRDGAGQRPDRAADGSDRAVRGEAGHVA